MHSEETLWRLVDGELPAAEAEALEAAARADPALAQRIEALRSIKREVLAGAPQPPAGFAARVAAAAVRRAQAPILDLADARRFLRRALIAAALLAAFGLAFFAFKALPEWMEPTNVYAGDDLLGP